MTTQDITNITAAAAKLNRAIYGTTNTVTPDMAAEYARLLAENKALKATVTAPPAKKTRIVEVPVCWTNSPHSRVRMLMDSLSMFGDLIRIRLNDLRGFYR